MKYNSNLEIFAKKNCTACFLLGVLQFFLPFTSIKECALHWYPCEKRRKTNFAYGPTDFSNTKRCHNKFNIMWNGKKSSVEAFFKSRTHKEMCGN